MATPQWDKLHLRLASGARDAVATASTAGKDLSVADRDNYLNYAYSKYILLLYNTYHSSNLEILKSAFQSMIKVVAKTAITGVIDPSAQANYGLFLSMVSDLGVSPIRVPQEDFNRIKYSVSGEIIATDDSQFCYPEGRTSIQILPVTIADDYLITYIAQPVTITQGGSTDIPLSDDHFDPLVSFALWNHYRDKQEFEIANMYLKDAYSTAPFPISIKE